MKHKNVKVGQTVKVKDTYNTRHPTFESRSKGRIGTVYFVEPLDHAGNLTVRVEFAEGRMDWGNHKDIKLLEATD